MPPTLRTLFPFQIEGARRLRDFVRKGGGCLLAGEQGVGKTSQLLYWMQRCPSVHPVVVVCPAVVKWNWQIEAKRYFGIQSDVLEGMHPERQNGGRFIAPSPLVIINYEILGPWLEYLVALRPGALVLDECFPYETPILTNRGWLPIGDIVEQRLDVSVLSRGERGLEWRNILHYFKNWRRDRLVLIKHEYGELICTTRHKIWTNQGYIEAGSLQVGDHLCLLRESLSSGPLDSTDGSVLQHSMLRSMASSSTELLQCTGPRGKGPQNIHAPIGYETPRCLAENEKEQSNAMPQDHTEDDQYQDTQRDLSFAREGPRGQRNGAYPRASETISSIREKVGNGIYSSNGGQTLPQSLQDRHRVTFGEDSNRSGRARPPQSPRQTKRSEEKGMLTISRVESITYPESRNQRASDGSFTTDQYCYDLEVAETHNYFARGISVSNCHYIKNWDSDRYKHAKTLAAGISKRIALTGTPLTNRPAELWAILSIICPDLFPERMKYMWTYTRPRKFRGRWMFPGAKHTRELHLLLTARCMIRQRKADVLDLPPKTRRVVEVPLSNPKEYQFAESNLLGWIKDRYGMERARRAAKVTNLVRLGYLMRLCARLKVRQVREWIDLFLENSEGKLVIFTGHTPMVDLLMRAYHGNCVRIDGSVVGRKRQLAVEEFQKGRKRLAACHYKAGGIGITLHAAADVLYTDLPLSAGDLLQSEDRIHRIGQHHPCTIWYLVVRGTIEARAAELVTTKLDVLDQIIDGKPAARNASTLDIFQQLIREYKPKLKR